MKMNLYEEAVLRTAYSWIAGLATSARLRRLSVAPAMTLLRQGFEGQAPTSLNLRNRLILLASFISNTLMALSYLTLRRAGPFLK